MAQRRAAAHHNSSNRGDHDTRPKPTKNVDLSCGSLLYHAGDLAAAESETQGSAVCCALSHFSVILTCR